MKIKKILFVYANPKKESLTRFILNHLDNFLLEKGIKSEIQDLYKLNFNPRLSEEEISGSNNNIKDALLINEIKNELKAANLIILIYPVWWWSHPAILKGWIDRIIINGFAFSMSKDEKRVGLFQDKKMTIIRTHGGDHSNTLGSIYKEIIRKPDIYTFTDFCGIQDIFEYDLYAARKLEAHSEKVNIFVSSIEQDLLKII